MIFYLISIDRLGHGAKNYSILDQFKIILKFYNGP